MKELNLYQLLTFVLLALLVVVTQLGLHQERLLDKQKQECPSGYTCTKIGYNVGCWETTEGWNIESTNVINFHNTTLGKGVKVLPVIVNNSGNINLIGFLLGNGTEIPRCGDQHGT